MPRRSVPPDERASSTLSIGELARATGVTPATIRMWESRHEFPRPLRLTSGHRRYSREDVALVLLVRQRQDAGVRLDIAVQQVLAAAAPRNRPAVFARISEEHPGQPHRRLTKSTLIGISHAIEDEAVATAQHAHLFASFQAERHYRSARDRWREITRVAASAHVFADFGGAEAGVDEGGGSGPVMVTLPADAPMLREWALVCDAPDLPVALLAWEPPGQHEAADRDRVFEVIWTVDARVVREAARWCAQAAVSAGSRRAGELVAGPLAETPVSAGPAPQAVGRLVLRILSHLDADPRR